ncbi:serine/arginine-rich splicing factor 4-like [Phalaenopsis equestris]|uniref:serine/arginine-rich splicing factor 4-like n=1 Tax=Phalaenopsis equestris TaxID=78828 RepID=UPI0009E208E4|nr:serine/arginine-rich splicing factor 4-like [Phalaenopsis equestris]XP_020581351.1 serine/arginine-rich splicing factor 4-like [Phalaenopsis equestris]XP_020581352.1 serine/arginine-rich splicing factor 4-like [Phalaenopsis equestris]
MSLYVGHLSPHVSQDELEGVFRRFGRCHFQLKDGYGFVVYEVTANAERALRALRGKQICGEQISLNWSNKQPRPFQRPPRGSRFDEPHRRRVFREEGDVTGFRSSQDERDFSIDIRSPAYNAGHRVDSAPDKEAGHTWEDVDGVRGNRVENLSDPLMDEDTGDLNPLEHDRWGERANDMLPGHGLCKDSDFDGYEPYHGYNKRNEKEDNQRASSDSSPYRAIHGKGHREHFIVEAERRFDKPMPHLACYNCGQVGHIRRRCPEGDGRRGRFTKFERRRDGMSFKDKVEGRRKKFQANSRGRPGTSIDPLVARHRAWDRKGSHSSKSVKTESSPERREKSRVKLHSRSQSKKGTKDKYSSKKRSKKKRRVEASETSSMSSDSSKSSSGKTHSKSISGSRSYSKSTSSSRSHPASSRSRSMSVSSYAKFKSSRSRSRSLSRSKSRSTPYGSLSLSISLGRKSSSSPKNIERNVQINTIPKNNSEHMESLESKHSSKMNNSETKTLKDENSFSPLGDKTQSNVEYYEKNSFNEHKTDLKVGYNKTDACFTTLNGAGSATENYSETSALQGSPMKNPIEQVAVDSTILSTREMLSALHHNGLASLKEGELDVSVEGYFGAARLWPWEMIYYRRLRRGPISTENYAKRLEQNKEFGIVDKYIRSCSGWGERQRNT